ncbi:MAG: flippase-like domain-containing protein [Chromatiales bacterium]|nr:flippase-like domain-containing protein [Chromatiales bacterium]
MRASQVRRPDGRTAAPSTTDWVAWLIGAAVLAAVVTAALHLAEEESLLHLLAAMNPAWLGAALLLQATTYLLQGQVWRQTLRAGGHSVTMAGACRLSLAKLFLDQAIPSLGISGNTLVAQALQRAGLPREVVLAAVVVDLAAYYAAYVACLCLALVTLGAEGHASGLVLGIGAIFVACGSVFAWGLPHLPGLLGRWQALDRRAHFAAPLLHLIAGARADLTANLRLRSQAGLTHAALIACDALTLYVLVLASGASASPGEVSAAYMVAAVFRTIGILPGGLGSFEAAAVVMLNLVGVPVGQALTATLLFRGLSFWLPMIPGYLSVRSVNAASSGIAA